MGLGQLGQPGAPEPSNNSAVDNGQPSGSPNADDDVWDEERIEKALKTLKEMHIQLRGLRTTIPRLIAPLSIKQPSPEALFHDFSVSASTANKEVQEFRRLMVDEESKKVMEQARKSRSENPQGIRPWLVTEHPDWLTRET